MFHHQRREHRADAGRGRSPDPRERVLPEQRRCRPGPGGGAAHRPRGARRRNVRHRERPSRAGPARGGRVLHPSALGSPALARAARRGPPLRHGPLRGRCPGSDVGRGLAGPRRRVDTAGHRRADVVGSVRPHHRPARRNCADSLGRPARPDHRASGACPGPCGAADRGTRGSRRRRHALRCPDSDARLETPPPTRSRTTWPGCGCSRAWRTTSTSSSPATARSAAPIRPARGSTRTAAYVHAVRDADVVADQRVSPAAKDGWDWVAGVHARQLQGLARRG